MEEKLCHHGQHGHLGSAASAEIAKPKIRRFLSKPFNSNLEIGEGSSSQLKTKQSSHMPKRDYGVAKLTWALQLVWESGLNCHKAAKLTGVSRQTIGRTIDDFNESVRFKSIHAQSSSE